MEIIILILVGMIALEHFAFMYIEMFLWTKKPGRKIFKNTIEEAQQTKILAANQGLYNGFLAAGLLFGLFYPEKKTSLDILVFFLVCILISGVYGGFTAKKSILLIQALPAAIVLLYIGLS